MHQDKPPASDAGKTAETANAGESMATESAEDTGIEIELELDNYVLEWFRRQGEQAEDLMNQALHDYIKAVDARSQMEPDEE